MTELRLKEEPMYPYPPSFPPEELMIASSEPFISGWAMFWIVYIIGAAIGFYIVRYLLRHDHIRKKDADGWMIGVFVWPVSVPCFAGLFIIGSPLIAAMYVSEYLVKDKEKYDNEH